jgi:hypothetical protein
MEVHNTLEHDMDCFIKECAHLFHERSFILFFCIQLFKHRVNIAFQHALASTTEKKTALTGDVCSRPPITTRFHDLHAKDIRLSCKLLCFGNQACNYSCKKLLPSFGKMNPLPLELG